MALPAVDGEDIDVRAMNDELAIVGNSQIDGIDYASCWKNGELEHLVTVRTGSPSCALDINAFGTAVGYVYRDGVQTCSYWTPGSTAKSWRQSLLYPSFLPPEHTIGMARGINDRHAVVGTALETGFLKHELDYTRIAGTGSVVPCAVSNANIVVGYVVDPDEQYPFRFSASIECLGTIAGSHGYALGINDSGWIVGASSFQLGCDDLHGFLWVDDQMYDLNELVQPSPSFTITEAAAINNNGLIAATAELQGENRALLLYPT